MTKTTTIINSHYIIMKSMNQKKIIKLSLFMESNLSIVKSITNTLLSYKHLENILNILLQQQLALSDNDNLTLQQKRIK